MKTFRILALCKVVESISVKKLDNTTERLTRRHGDAVSLGVKQSANLCEVTVPLNHILNTGGLHEECIAAFAFGHTLHSFHI